MKAIALIPARLEASRFPRKLLTLIQVKVLLLVIEAIGIQVKIQVQVGIQAKLH